MQSCTCSYGKKQNKKKHKLASADTNEVITLRPDSYADHDPQYSDGHRPIRLLSPRMVSVHVVQVRKLSSEYTPGLGPRLYSEASRAQPYTKVVCLWQNLNLRTWMARETKCIIVDKSA